MKEKFLHIPSPLQRQILIRAAGCGLSLTVLIFLIVYRCDWHALLPCAVLSIVCSGDAGNLFCRCSRKKYVVITGDCIEIEKSPLHRTVKAYYIRDSQSTIKIMNPRKIKHLLVGDPVMVYIADNAPVYELDGDKIICGCLAMVKGNA